MHELAITKAIADKVKRACREKKIKKPKKAVVELGELTTYAADPIKLYWRLFTKDDKKLKNTSISIRTVRGRLKCDVCRWRGVAKDKSFLFCGSCSSPKISILKGRDIILKEIVEG
jgi:Zn finger protein HypA/HybF involved in hydrogenase expression